MAGSFADIRCLHSGELGRLYLCLFDAWKSAPSEPSLFSLGAFQFFWSSGETHVPWQASSFCYIAYKSGDTCHKQTLKITANSQGWFTGVGWWNKMHEVLKKGHWLTAEMAWSFCRHSLLAFRRVLEILFVFVWCLEECAEVNVHCIHWELTSSFGLK